MTATLHLPDVSEWQAGADLSRLQAVILRAYNGYRPDRAYAAHRRSASKALVIGHYVYLVASRDAAAQGREAAAVIGRLRAGEFAVVDCEEGAGDQSARVEAAASALDHALGGHAFVYSGASFFGAQLAGVTRTRWVASYGVSEPRGPHLLWQHSNSEAYSGIGKVDCSLFHGTATDLRTVVDRLQGRAAPVLVKPPLRKPVALPVAAVAPPLAQYKGQVLRVGSRGLAVAALQRTLKVGADGDFGPLTLAALSAFQQAHGVPRTGVTDAATWARLVPPPAKPAVVPPNTHGLLVLFVGHPEVYELHCPPTGPSSLVWVTAAQWAARGLKRADVHNLPPTDRLAHLKGTP